MSPFGRQKKSGKDGPKYTKINSADKKVKMVKASPPPQMQNVAKNTIFVFGAGNDNIKDVENSAIELSEMRSRKENWGIGEGVEELKKNHYIDHVVAAEDSLPKLALQFGCTITQLKQANGIYNDQDLFAYKTLRIPIYPHGLLWETFTKKRNSLEKDPFDLKNDFLDKVKRSHSDPDLKHSRMDFSVKDEQDAHHLNFLTTDCSYSDDEDEFGNNENRNLLQASARTSTNLNDTNNAYEEYLETFDKDFKKISNKVQSRSDVIDITKHSIAYMQPDISIKRSNSEKLGRVGWVNYKGILIVMCIIVVLIPIIYIIYFKVLNKNR